VVLVTVIVGVVILMIVRKGSERMRRGGKGGERSPRLLKSLEVSGVRAPKG
jgi:hypothetical protein